VSEPTGSDPLDELRSADPVAPDRLPSASLARMSARVQEDIMSTNVSSAGRRRFVIPAAAAATLAGIALVVVVVGRGPAPDPGIAVASASPGTQIAAASPSPLLPVGPVSAFCMERYSPQTLADRSFSFDGTVARIAGDEVTFRVGHWFKGAAGDPITLTATGMTGTAITSAGGPHLAVGERYLVAGEDHFAWACGFTQPYDAAVAAEWAAATGG
jgi:hypothetical protein